MEISGDPTQNNKSVQHAAAMQKRRKKKPKKISRTLLQRGPHEDINHEDVDHTVVLTGQFINTAKTTRGRDSKTRLTETVSFPFI